MTIVRGLLRISKHMINVNAENYCGKYVVEWHIHMVGTQHYGLKPPKDANK